MRRILEKINQVWKKTKRPMAMRMKMGDEIFLKDGQEQLKELARKGLSIPVFTL